MSEQRTLIDISVTLYPGLVVWPGDPRFERTSISSLNDGGEYSVSQISMGSHTGTHVDAPAHFIRDGLTAEALSLEALVGEVLVIKFDDEDTYDTCEGGISASHLRSIDLTNVDRLLLKTSNSKLPKTGESSGKFSDRYNYLTADAAQYLVDKGIKLVGIDYLSIDKPGSDDAHRILLGSGVVILETIDLSQVEPGRYELLCLPLKILGADGAPARALLRTL